MPIYVGSYPPEADGDGTGISIWHADLRPAAPTVALPAPSYLLAHPARPVLYAVDELVDGGVTALAMAPDGALTVLARQASGGSEPCHLAVTADGGHLLCANYGTGSVAVFALDSDGTITARTGLVQHRGSGPDPSRQLDAHAHHVSVLDGTVTAVDLGTDTLYGYHLDPAGRLTAAWTRYAGAGSGPRHLVVAPDGRRYVTDELGSTVSVYRPEPDGLHLVHRRPATLTQPAGANYPSGIALSADGRFVYVANRGNDTIVTFAVDGDRLGGVHETASGGAWPRQFTLDADLMYVANQHSHRVSVLRVDPHTGVPRATGDRIEVPSPACVLIAR